MIAHMAKVLPILSSVLMLIGFFLTSCVGRKTLYALASLKNCYNNIDNAGHRLQVFGSLLSRDSTFKFMTHVWKRAMRGMHITADETGMMVDEVSREGMST